MPWPEPLSVSAGSQAMATAAYRLGFTFRAPKSGTIQRIVQFVSTFTAGNTMRCRVTPVLAGGYPDIANLLAPGAEGTFTPTATGPAEFVLNTPVAVTRGQLIGIDVCLDVFSSTFSLLRAGTDSVAPSGDIASSTSTNGTSYSGNGNVPVGAIMMDGAWTHIPWLPTYSTVVTDNFNTGTTYDEIGAKFKMPFDAYVHGWYLIQQAWFPTTVGGSSFNIYDSSNNLLVTHLREGIKSAQINLTQQLLPSGVALTKDQTYRMTLKAIIGSASMKNGVTPTNALTPATVGGVDFIKTQRKAGGAWTDVDTQTPCMGLLIAGAGSQPTRFVKNSSGVLVPI